MVTQSKRDITRESKTLVIYHYYEKDKSYIDNFSHFLRFGYDADLSYLIIVAGEYTIDFPALDNIQYLFTENKNFDYGGYCEAVSKLSIWQKYDFYFFVNSSVRGPFAPAYCAQKWADLFIDQISADVGIVGAAISITPSQHSIAKMYHDKYGKLERNHQFLGHVQTTCYVLSQQVLGRLIKAGFYEVNEALNKDETVRDYEIRLSQLLLDMGLNLRCMLPEYNQIDYREVLTDLNPASREGDSGFEHSYFGRSAHPYESIFIKTSRNTFSTEDLMRLAYSMSMHHKLPIYLEELGFMQSFIGTVKSFALQLVKAPTLGRKNIFKSLFKRET
ncbi:hypothetical protein [Polynucleobacter sp. MWH-Berg-3C6]|uniref:hypothetical protein n=1 Tax=Polynucleobacter sp. MWH-Berg-3C6 TaxID=1855882 RepID=UPI001C0D6F89|nr:hypothetical protein [Polynucleobacter sp. MWH-Berg-3C6]MBU3549838.1 hypothetical protein [Polynucleobacter sp. MWH-Berg-3C6]